MALYLAEVHPLPKTQAPQALPPKKSRKFPTWSWQPYSKLTFQAQHLALWQFPYHHDYQGVTRDDFACSQGAPQL